jgi:hypothetical protein
MHAAEEHAVRKVHAGFMHGGTTHRYLSMEVVDVLVKRVLQAGSHCTQDQTCNRCANDQFGQLYQTHPKVARKEIAGLSYDARARG